MRSDRLRFLIPLILLVFTVSAADGQYFQAVRGMRNGVYAEAYLTPRDFTTGFISLNYEHFFGDKYRNSIRVGVLPDFRSSLAVPVTYTYITRPYDNHHLEIGVGLVSLFEFFEGTVYHDIAVAMLPVMYRYTNKSRFYFRAGVNIFYSWPVLPSPSVSMGFRF